MADKPKLENVVIEDARLLFRNFAGRADPPYNAEGDRNFCVILPGDLADKMRSDGWNVKSLRVRDEGDVPEAYVQVKVNYGTGRPPRCVLITETNKVDLGPDEVAVFDAADIKTADIILNPFAWDVNGNTGVKAYLKSAFITINEDPLELKYADSQTAAPTASIHDEDDD